MPFGRAKLWRKLAEAHSPEEEVKRIRSDSERYDIGINETGFTLYEGLPLRPQCKGDFEFREVRRDMTNGHPVRVFAYRQIHPCGIVAYHFLLPGQFADAPLLDTSEMALDAETGQVVREERNVNVGNSGKHAPRVAHLFRDYAESLFGICVPKKIVTETFLPGTAIERGGLRFPPARTYGADVRAVLALRSQHRRKGVSIGSLKPYRRPVRERLRYRTRSHCC